jgi:hypothetical protein
VATIPTTDDNFQHFAASAGDTIVFARPTSSVILSVAVNTVQVSFDGKTGTVTLQTGTHHLIGLHVTSLVFSGTGSLTGAGLCY